SAGGKYQVASIAALMILSQRASDFYGFAKIKLCVVGRDRRRPMSQDGAGRVKAELAAHLGCLCVPEVVRRPVFQDVFQTGDTDCVRDHSRLVPISWLSLRVRFRSMEL